MLVLKVKYFDHVKRDWAYLDGVFYSHPDALAEIRRQQRRAYNENEVVLEEYVVCEDCGSLTLKDEYGAFCECGATYDRWGERLWTSRKNEVFQ